MKRLFSFLLAFSFFLPGAWAKETATVVSVYDGDTFTVQLGGQEENVRIIGIDTPELRAGNKPTCYGDQAADYAKRALTGEEVILVADEKTGNRDAFGRLLRYVYIDGGSRDFGRLMILRGFARVYLNETYKFKRLYEFIDRKAELKKMGLWKDCAVENKSTERRGVSPAAVGIVKMSGSRICHDSNSEYYEQTKKFTAYNTLTECLAAGGRLPK